MSSIELRWLRISDNERILQYREKVNTTDYSKSNYKNGHILKDICSEWKNVPEVIEYEHIR
jgi:hypothetical protein